MPNGTVVRLRTQVAALQARNRDLKNRLGFFERTFDVDLGADGEDLVAKATGGLRRSKVARYDLLVGLNTQVEVKTSNLTKVYSWAPTLRWAWMKVYGHDNKKPFKYLVLLGVVDERYRAAYKDPQAPYVAFVLPRAEVVRFCQSNGRHFGIQLTTNPATVRSRGKLLFTKYQVTATELRRLFRRIKRTRTNRQRVRAA